MRRYTLADVLGPSLPVGDAEAMRTRARRAHGGAIARKHGDALERWLDSHDAELTRAKRGDLLSFMASRIEAGARPRSTARQLSSFRRFYRYLVREGALREDPTAQIAMPKVGTRCHDRSRRRKSRPCWPLRP